VAQADPAGDLRQLRDRRHHRAGGAWNARSSPEVVSYGSTTLTATGLGAYIAQATGSGDASHILIGVAVMSLYVVGLNRLFWRRLYALASAASASRSFPCRTP